MYFLPYDREQRRNPPGIEGAGGQLAVWLRYLPGSMSLEPVCRRKGGRKFCPRPDVPPENLEGEVTLSVEAFNQKFRGNPIKRAKRRGYLRNTAVVLGNRERLEDVPALTAALQDSESLVRQHAAWALGKVGGTPAKLALLNALPREVEAAVIAEIEAALSLLEQ